MTDLHARFRTLDGLQAPDLWSEVEARATATQPRHVRTVPWVLIAAALVLAVTLAGAALIGSGIIQLPVLPVLPDGSPMPSSSPDQDAEPTATPTPAGPLGGGLLLVYEAHDPQPATQPPPLHVFMLDAGTGQQTLLGTLPAPISFQEYDLQWGADRKHVLITTDSGDLFTPLDDPTDAARDLAFICCDPAFESVPLSPQSELSPQSDRIASLNGGDFAIPGCLLCADAPASVSIRDIDGGNLRSYPLPTGTLSGGAISWSPDGSTVVVAGCRPCNNAGAMASGAPGLGGEGGNAVDAATLTPTAVHHAHLFIVPVDGSPVRELFDETETMFGSPAWSPDGTTIAFGRIRCPADEHAPYCQHGTSQLVTMTVHDGRQRVVTDLAAGLPAWSPDGRRLTFGSETGLFVVDADGSNLTKLAEGSWSDPSWSPDGEWIAFSIYDEAQDLSGPWIVSADGGEPRLLGPFGGWAW